jgi:hypothetical protein
MLLRSERNRQPTAEWNEAKANRLAPVAQSGAKHRSGSAWNQCPTADERSEAIKQRNREGVLMLCAEWNEVPNLIRQKSSVQQRRSLGGVKRSDQTAKSDKLDPAARSATRHRRVFARNYHLSISGGVERSDAQSKSLALGTIESGGTNRSIEAEAPGISVPTEEEPSEAIKQRNRQGVLLMCTRSIEAESSEISVQQRRSLSAAEWNEAITHRLAPASCVEERNNTTIKQEYKTCSPVGCDTESSEISF